MSEIVERYFISLVNRLDETHKAKETKIYSDLVQKIKEEAKTTHSISTGSKSNFSKFFKHLIIISMCPHQQETLDDIENHLEQWYQANLQNIGSQNIDPDNFTLTPNQTTVLLRKWKEKKEQNIATKKKKAELSVVLKQLNYDGKVLSDKQKSLGERAVSKGQTSSTERQMNYIQSDMIYLIDQLNLRIRNLNQNMTQSRK